MWVDVLWVWNAVQVMPPTMEKWMSQMDFNDTAIEAIFSINLVRQNYIALHYNQVWITAITETYN